MEIVLDTKSKISEKTQEPQNLALRFQNQVGGHPPFSPFLFSKFSFVTIILPKHFDHFPDKRDIVSGPLPLFLRFIERSLNACI
jgi:hypothetical protein